MLLSHSKRFMFFHIPKTAGTSVMYAYYMHLKLKENTFVDMKVFSMDLFPMGMFSKKY